MRPKRKKIMISLLLVTFLSVIAGCQSDGQTGAVVGSLAGAGIGQLAGRDTESTLIGAAVGGGIGYILGNESDKQKAEEERYRIAAASQEVTVWVKNTNNSQIPVRLKSSGAGYYGPRGEYYSSMPSGDQLRVVYGF